MTTAVEAAKTHMNQVLAEHMAQLENLTAFDLKLETFRGEYVLGEPYVALVDEAGNDWMFLTFIDGQIVGTIDGKPHQGARIEAPANA